MVEGGTTAGEEVGEEGRSWYGGFIGEEPLGGEGVQCNAEVLVRRKWRHVVRKVVARVVVVGGRSRVAGEAEWMLRPSNAESILQSASTIITTICTVQTDKHYTIAYPC